MDSSTCNVIYVDRNVSHKGALESTSTDFVETGELRTNLQLLINAFGQVHTCTNGAECLERLTYLHDTSLVELKPTLVLIDTPHDEQLPLATPLSRDPSPYSRVKTDEDKDESTKDLYGIKLLEKLVYETHLRSLSKLVVPISIISSSLLRTPPATDSTAEGSLKPPYTGYLSEGHDPLTNSLTSRALLRKCMDLGAVDIMASPLHVKTLTSLEVHAYRAHKEAAKEQQAQLEFRRGRKRSWVGIHDEKPFAYLREAMVSGLMGGICRLGEESEDRISSVQISVSSESRAKVQEAMGQWHFCAPEFCEDTLLIAAVGMFEHALSMPELEKWRIPTDQLTTFIVACRAAYNKFVPYHNFRHAVDVLQATFDFLVKIGAIPPYPSTSHSNPTPIEKTTIATLLDPFEALTLLVSAIGHDVGHPGVNNGFLVVLNAPLAQLYNDRSVLESFHCAAYSQILRRYWPQVFQDTKMRSLMISTILATDMGLHFDYMKKLSDLQEKLKANPSMDGWNDRTREEHRALVCSLLIKCADISNVARKYNAALRWMTILCDEFSRQFDMEQEIGIPSSLIAPPKKDFLSLANAQLGFVNLFAIPLFQGVTEILPHMEYTVIELEQNVCHFKAALEGIPNSEEQTKTLLTGAPFAADGMEIVEKWAGGDGKFSTEFNLSVPVPENHAEMKKAGSSPPEQTTHVPSLPEPYKEVHSMFNGAEDFAASDPFHSEEHEDRLKRPFDSTDDFRLGGSPHLDEHDNRLIGHDGKQRSSETTEASSSAAPCGDWQSQATSATTSKMPLSPSTQGTSIVSQESIERPTSHPTTVVTAPDSSSTTTPIACVDSAPPSEEESSATMMKPDGTLKKKTSRFRMNVSNLFRRNKVMGSPSSGGSSS
ncbi:HD-domain/PDEase-like protein [Xylariaceae sp. FL0255]|nr:HD-domain/PDEase-like protein [Xylariaceae sp. FL0255]